MTDQRIEAHKVTKPIQLLAAWLVGLILTNGIFLAAALELDVGSWERSALVVSAIANVPIFLIALFVLQTRFRAELQEDAYYSTYLNQKTNELVTVEKGVVRTDELLKRIDTIELRFTEVLQVSQRAPVPASTDITALLFGVNKNFKDRESIKSGLAEYGLTRCTSFGSDESPGSRVVSVSEYLSPDVRDRVLRIVAELGFQHYRLYDNQREESEEDVLIGSYGEPEFEILNRTPNNALQATRETARA